jgi:deoxyribose-phosphate aldolase
MNTRPSSAGVSRAILAQRLISLTDLTSLNESDDAASVHALSLLACRAPVKPAAVCIWARWIPVALDALRGTGIPVCAVANFPGGAAATQPAATPDAAAVLLDVIAAAGGHGRSIGFKASGGIRTIDDAMVYLTLYEQRFGSGSASPGNFRIGASALFKELLAAAAMS